MRAQVDAKRVHDEALPQVRHQVSRDGVGADRHQREGPPAVSSHLGQPAEARQEEKAEPTAEESPRGRPDPLHHRADAGEVKHESGDDADGAGAQQAPQGDGRSRRAQPLTAGEAEDHGAKGRDETQRKIATAIFHVRLDARVQVEEPHVERVA